MDIKEIKDSYSFSFDSEKNIVSVVLLKRIEDKKGQVWQAEAMTNDINDLFKKYPDRKISSLVDLTPLEKRPYLMAREARGIYKDMISDERIGRMAIVTENKIIKTVTRFILSASGKSDQINFFSSKEEAVKWIGEAAE